MICFLMLFNNAMFSKQSKTKQDSTANFFLAGPFQQFESEHKLRNVKFINQKYFFALRIIATNQSVSNFRNQHAMSAKQDR